MKTVIVHDWLTGYGGAEKVLKWLLELFPSPVFTLIHDEKKIKFDSALINTSFLQHLPLSREGYRNYLPLFPSAIERFNLEEYDLIISSSHAVAKGVKTHPNQLHICYCHTPMRYAWDLEQQYLESVGSLKGAVARQVLKYLRKWDLKSNHGIDHFVANSRYIAERIQRLYGRDSTVIYPPVETDHFEVGKEKEDYYLTLSRLVPYKKVDLIVTAFNQMPHRKIKIVGEGPELEQLKMQAGPNIEFLGFREEIKDLLKKAKGFVFAAEEDFGIAPVEAEACGTPVIAYWKGGVSETVLEGKTGLFFEEQTAKSLIDAVDRFEKIQWNGTFIREHSEQFGVDRFKREIKSFVDQKWEIFCENRNSCRR